MNGIGRAGRKMCLITMVGACKNVQALSTPESGVGALGTDSGNHTGAGTVPPAPTIVQVLCISFNPYPDIRNNYSSRG